MIIILYLVIFLLAIISVWVLYISLTELKTQIKLLKLEITSQVKERRLYQNLYIASKRDREQLKKSNNSLIKKLSTLKRKSKKIILTTKNF